MGALGNGTSGLQIVDASYGHLPADAAADALPSTHCPHCPTRGGGRVCTTNEARADLCGFDYEAGATIKLNRTLDVAYCAARSPSLCPRACAVVRGRYYPPSSAHAHAAKALAAPVAHAFES